MIRNASEQDARRMAEIHSRELRGEFLPSLGLGFLTKLYKDLLKARNAINLVYSDEEGVQGLVVGSVNVQKDLRTIIKKSWFTYSLLVLPLLVKKPVLIKNFIETLLYSGSSEGKTKAELLVIAVSRSSQRKGLGSKLLNALERTFKYKKTKQYKLSVNAKNKNAILFYTRQGFTKKSEFSLYGKRMYLLLKSL